MSACSQQTNKGGFRKGQSGNPGGRPAVRMPDGRSLTEIAREHTEDAIVALALVLHDKRTPAAARVAAANALLDRGWGRPAQFISATTESRSVVQLSELECAARIGAILELARERKLLGLSLPDSPADQA